MAISVSLEGKTAIVTGGGTGVGFGCATRLIDAGATVTIVGRRPEVLESAAEKLKAQAADESQVRFMRADISVEDDAAASMAFAAEPTGRLDFAVANVGGGASMGTLRTLTRENLQACFDINVVTALLTFKHAVQQMRDGKGGSLVAISSVQGMRPAQFACVDYSMAKAALDMLVRIAAVEFAPFDIRVNALRVGLVQTEGEEAAITEATRKLVIDETLLGRIGMPEEVGDGVLYLVSDLSKWVTGQILGVCGGASAFDHYDFSADYKTFMGMDAFNSATRDFITGSK